MDEGRQPAVTSECHTENRMHTIVHRTLDIRGLPPILTKDEGAGTPGFPAFFARTPGVCCPHPVEVTGSNPVTPIQPRSFRSIPCPALNGIQLLLWPARSTRARDC